MILQKSIQEVIEASKIEEVVGDFVNLRRRGVNLAGLCPFHHEKTPSFYVSPAKNIFKCFGCAKGGTPVQFVMEHENLSFPDAIRYLARKYKIELEETEATAEVLEEQQLVESLYLVNQFASQFFQDQLVLTDKGKTIGLAYFKHRGFKEETIRKFGLGFAPESGDALTRLAVEKGYSIDLLRSLGLCSSSDRDFFRNRVMFPIHNLSGKVIAFAGRIMNKDPKAPKYINSPETDIYQKSKVLFGAFQAKTAIRKEDACFLVEGYTDVISLHQNGIENVVASSGTSLTIGQIRLIKRFTNNLVILYDGDQAGVRAALRGLDLALEEDMAVRVVILPDGEDPDSFVQKVGKEDFSVFIKNNAQDIIQLEAGILLQQSANDPTKRAELIGHIAHTISRVKNPIRRDEYIRNVRELLQVDEGKLVLEINRILQKEVEKFAQRQELEPRGAPASSEQGADAAPGASEKGIAPEFGDGYQEKDIARLLITAGNKRFDSEEELSVAEYVLMNIEDVLAEFDQPLYKQVVEITFQLVMDKREVSLDFFLHHPEESIRQLAINLSSSPYEYSENWEKRHDIGLSQNPPEENHRKDAENLIKRFKLRKIRRFKERNARKMNDLFQANGPDEEIEACMQLHLKLKAIETQLAKELGTVVLK